MRKLTEYVFPQDVEADVSDTLQLTQEDWAELSGYLQFHGLQLPPGAKASLAYSLCRDLNLRLGQGIRLAAAGRKAEICILCPQLTETEQAYCAAVGGQNQALARQLARKVFGLKAGPFFV